MRASSAVPGIIAPASIAGRLYSDGQLSSPMPVMAARQLGADVVIASRHENELKPALAEILKGTERRGAYFVADIAHINGLIVGGVHPDPVPYADVVTSTSHKAIRGPRGRAGQSRRRRLPGGGG